VLEGRLGSEHRGGLGWRGGWFGFEGRETNCLQEMELATQTVCKAPEEIIQRTLENIETDAAELVNIGVVNLGQESDLRRCHRVIIWEE
jgi:hypothetical protein